MTRRLPPHIVLPNGMWRFVKRGHKAAKRAGKKTRRVRSVAKRYRRRSGGGFGMGKLLSKKNLMYTIGATLIGGALLKVDPKLAGAVGGFLGAGPIGAVGGYLAGPTIAKVGGGLMGSIGTNGISAYST